MDHIWGPYMFWKQKSSDFIKYLTKAAGFLTDSVFCRLWYWRKAWKSCWGQMCSASVSLMSCGRRSGQTRRQATRCLRIILSDMLRNKRADLHFSVSHWNDPEMTQWTVSNRQTESSGSRWMWLLRWMLNADEVLHEQPAEETYGKQTIKNSNKSRYLMLIFIMYHEEIIHNNNMSHLAYLTPSICMHIMHMFLDILSWPLLLHPWVKVM